MYTVNVLSGLSETRIPGVSGEDLGSPSARPGIDCSVRWLSLATIRTAGFAVQLAALSPRQRRRANGTTLTGGDVPGVPRFSYRQSLGILSTQQRETAKEVHIDVMLQALPPFSPPLIPSNFGEPRKQRRITMKKLVCLVTSVCCSACLHQWCMPRQRTAIRPERPLGHSQPDKAVAAIHHHRRADQGPAEQRS